MRRTAIDLYDGPTTIGIDVSAHQGRIGWARVARSEAVFHGQRLGPVRYAIIRAADGIQTRRDSRPDPMAVRNLTQAAEAGIEHLAVYLYLRAYHPADEQLELVLDVIRTAGVPVGWLGIDVEGRPDDPTTPNTDESHGAWYVPDGVEGPVSTADVLADVLEVARGARRAGLRPVVYTGQSWHWHVAQRGLAPPARELGDLWVPWYGRAAAPRLPVGPAGQPAPWGTWTLWQFAGSSAHPGRVAGIDGAVDLNRFRGDEDALRSWWAGERASERPPSRVLEESVDEVLEIAQRLKAAHPEVARRLVEAVAKG
ncbi:MAG: glycoside hydrolase family 25 protein [Sandaracinaceae bacterium]